MSGHSTLMRYAGATVPDDLVDRALLNSNYVSVAFFTMAKDKQPAVAVIKKKLADLKDQKAEVTKVLGMIKDKDMLIHFGTLEPGEKDEMMQPYEVAHNSDSKPNIVACYDNVENAFEENKDWLSPKVHDIMETYGWDLEKTTEKLKGTTKDFRAICSADSQVSMLLATGVCLAFNGTNKIGVDYDGGWATNSFEDKPITTTTMPDPEPEVISEEEQVRRALEGDEPPAQDEPGKVHKTNAEPKPLNMPKETPKEHPSVARRRAAEAANAVNGAADKTHPPGGTKDDNYVPLKLKDGLRQNDLLKIILRHIKDPSTLGDWWGDYQKGNRQILIPKATGNNTALASAMADATAKKETATAQPPVVDPKAKPDIPGMPKIDPKIAEQLKKVKPASEIFKELPVLTAEERENVQKKFLSDPVVVALMGADGNNIDDPTLIKVEDKHDDFAHQLGLPSLVASMHWNTDATLERLQNAEPRALRVLLRWYQYELLMAMRGGYKLSRTKETKAVHPSVARRQQAAAAK